MFLEKEEQIDVVDRVNFIWKLMENSNPLWSLKFDENLNEHQLKELKSLLNKYSHICWKTDYDLGYCDKYKFDIKTESANLEPTDYRMPNKKN